MKKIILITGIILIGCTILSFTASSESDSESVLSQTNIQSTQTVYTIGSYNGKIAVFENGSSKPLIETETIVNSLPQNDIIRIEKGFEIEGKDNLKKFLEDYCS